MNPLNRFVHFLDFPSCLLAHLRCCHPRFRFRGVQQPQTQKLLLQIFLDESYDGSNDCTPLPRSYRPRADSATENGLDISLTVTSASKNEFHFPMIGGWTGYSGDSEHNLRYARKLATSRFLRSRRSPLKRAPFFQLLYWKAVECVSSSVRKVITRFSPFYIKIISFYLTYTFWCFFRSVSWRQCQ